MLIYFTMALLSGFLIANQNPVNADVRKIFSSPFLAASLSFFIGSAFLGVLSLTMGGGLFPSLAFISSNPWWIWLGGFLGAVYLTSNVLLFPRLGAVQTVILPILGMILMGTVIDTLGWFGAKPVEITLTRIFGVLIMMIGVFTAVVLPNLKNEKIGEKVPKNLVLWQIWGIVVGGFSAIQQAINGHLGKLLKSPSQGAFLSFFIGFILIFILALLVDKRLPNLAQFKSMKAWHGLGGILGGLFVFGSVLAVPQIGAGFTIMLSLIGQIVGAMLIQQFGWWRSAKYRIQIWQIIGVLVMIFGIVLIKFL